MSVRLEQLNGDGAVFDTQPTTAIYRYRLWRKLDVFGASCTFVMLNPSTARHDVPDPTITRCVGFAKRERFSRLEVVNLFAYRATDSSELQKDNVIGPENDEHIIAALEDSDLVVCAWGTKVPRHHTDRVRRVKELIRECGCEPVCLGLTKGGHPKHPLYLSSDTELVPYV